MGHPSTPREQYRPECLSPTVKGSSGSVMLWGAFSWHGLSRLVPLEGRLTANQYKDAQDDNTPIHSARGLTEWFSSIMCKSHDMALAVIRSQPN